VVHEKKIFEDLSNFFLLCPLLGPKRDQPHYLNKYESPSPKHVSYQIWLKMAWSLKGIILQMDDADDGRITMVIQNNKKKAHRKWKVTRKFETIEILMNENTM